MSKTKTNGNMNIAATTKAKTRIIFPASKTFALFMTVALSGQIPASQ